MNNEYCYGNDFNEINSEDMRTAMQRAQLKGYRKYKHPIAWAAFQMTGGL